MELDITDSQVEIRQRPVQWDLDGFNDHSVLLVFYDEYHQEIVLLTEHCIWVSHSPSCSLSKFQFSVYEYQHVKNAKFSPDKEFIGFQIETTEIKVLTRAGDMVAIQTCRNSKAANRILAFHWIISDAADLCLVTLHGAELYKLNVQNKTLKCVKTFKYETKHHWNLASHQFLVLVDSKHVFQGLQITKTKPEKINKFEIVGVQKSTLDRNSFYHQISLFDFDGTVGCVFVDEKKAKVYVFMLHQNERGRSTMKLTNQFELYSRGSYEMSIVDNVLVAYNIGSQTFVLLDLNETEVKPICMPHPILTRQEQHSGDFKVSPLQYTRGSTRFLKPNFVLDTDKRCLYTLELNLREIIDKWNPEKRKELLRFLLKRGVESSKQASLDLLNSLIDSYCTSEGPVLEEFELISNFFLCINHVLYQGLMENSNAKKLKTPLTRNRQKTLAGFTIIKPIEIVQYTLNPHIEKGPKLLNIVLEYVRSLHRHKLKIPHTVTDLVVHLCDQQKDYYSLHQLLQYHALPDDPSLANKLLSLRTSYPPAKQLAIDMMLRLKMYTTIIEILLKENNILPALSLYLSKFSLWSASSASDVQLPVSIFLEAAKRTEDPVLFYNVYRRIESQQVAEFEGSLKEHETHYLKISGRPI